MTVSQTPTVVVPRQASPDDRADALPPPAAAAAAPVGHPAPLLGRDRPLTTDERQFAVGLAVLVLVLGTIIVGGLLLAEHVWT